MRLSKQILLALLALTLILSVVIPTERYVIVSLIVLALFGLTVVRPAVNDVLTARKQSQLLPPAERKHYLKLTYIVNISTVMLVVGVIALVVGFASSLTF